MIPTHNSSYIDDFCFYVSKLSGFRVPVLCRDTEMFTEDITLRMAAAITGVSFWHLDTGNWRRNPEMLHKVRETIKKIREGKYIFKHLHVGNKDIDQIISLAKRWYYTKVGRGNPAIIAYYYIKLTAKFYPKNDAIKKIERDENIDNFIAEALKFIAKYQDEMSGVLTGFDRLVFRGVTAINRLRAGDG